MIQRLHTSYSPIAQTIHWLTAARMPIADGVLASMLPRSMGALNLRRAPSTP